MIACSAAMMGSLLAAVPPDGPNKFACLDPVDISVDVAALDATVTSTSFNTKGWGKLTVACEHVNSAATEIQVRVQHSSNYGGDDSTATWEPVHAGNVTEGTGEYNDEILDYEPYKTVSGDDDLTFTVPIKHSRMRIVVTDTGGGADDKISCYALLGR